MLSSAEILSILENAELRLNQWISSGKSLELCDELSDLCALAGLANDCRAAMQSGSADLPEALLCKIRVLLLPKSSDDRLNALVLLHCRNDLSARLQRMYSDFSDEMHFSVSPVHFSDGMVGLCICRGDLFAYPYQYLKNETAVHRSGEEECTVSVLPLREAVSSEGFQIEAFAHPDNHRIHRSASCARVSRDGLSCESLAQRSAVQNRNLALSALAARLEVPDHIPHFTRSYDFSCGALSDCRLKESFSPDNPLPLFESLLLAE